MPLLTLREERAIKRGFRKGRKEGQGEGLEQGREQGLEQGLEQGREQGREQGLREAIERGLELRFGRKGRELFSRVDKIEGAEALMRLYEALFTAKGIEEIRSLLPKR